MFCLRISFRPEGLKYQKAREWKIPVVNTQFIAELFLGHASALQMIHSPKYQCFNPDQPLRLDFALAPPLMGEWMGLTEQNPTIDLVEWLILNDL